jgi:hypothetical protein
VTVLDTSAVEEEDVTTPNVVSSDPEVAPRAISDAERRPELVNKLDRSRPNVET